MELKQGTWERIVKQHDNATDGFWTEQFWKCSECEYMRRDVFIPKHKPNYCEECGQPYHTFSHRTKYCENCKEEIKRYNRENWQIHWTPPSINETDLEMWGYDDWDSFWEGLI